MGRMKATVRVYPDILPMEIRPLCVQALAVLVRMCEDHIVTDRGHSHHASNVTEFSIWFQSARGAAAPARPPSGPRGDDSNNGDDDDRPDRKKPKTPADPWSGGLDPWSVSAGQGGSTRLGRSRSRHPTGRRRQLYWRAKTSSSTPTQTSACVFNAASSATPDPPMVRCVHSESRPALTQYFDMTNGADCLDVNDLQLGIDEPPATRSLLAPIETLPYRWLPSVGPTHRRPVATASVGNIIAQEVNAVLVQWRRDRAELREYFRDGGLLADVIAQLSRPGYDYG